MTSPTTERPTAVASLAAAVVAGLVAATATGLAMTPWPTVSATLAAAALPVARLLLDGCAVAAVGIFVLCWLATSANRRDAESVFAAAAQAAVVVAGVWAALALVVLWLQAAQASGRPAGSVDTGTSLR